jgi:hypothetical protein
MIAPTRRLGDVCILQHYEGGLVSLRETRISCPIDVRTLCRDRGKPAHRLPRTELGLLLKVSDVGGAEYEPH